MGASAILLPQAFRLTALKSSAYPAVAGDMVPCDASAGGFTVTLPTAVGITLVAICVVKVVSTVNLVTLATTGGQTINGLSTLDISALLGMATVIPYNSNWILVTSPT